jgi:hypothetical protein
VYGNVETNDLVVFTDRTAGSVRGTNFTALVSGVSSNTAAGLVAAEAVLRAQGDVAGSNYTAAVRSALLSSNALARAAIQAEAVLRAQGDALALPRASLAAFAATGSVTRLLGDGSWLVISNGTVTQWCIETDTNQVRIVSASVDFNGAPVGSVLSLSEPGPPIAKYESNGIRFETVESIPGEEYFTGFFRLDIDAYWQSDPTIALTMPATLTPAVTAADGTCVIDWFITTNAYPLTKRAAALLRDGSQAMTGDLDMGNHSITNLSPNTIYFTDGRSLPSIIPSAGWRNDVYWSIGMEERYQAVSQTIVTTNQDVITYREIAGIGRINWQITPNVLRGFPDGAFGFSVSGSAGSIDQNGLLTMESVGLVDVTVTNGAISKTVAVDLYYSSQGEERSCIYGDVPGSARAAATAGIDGRLSGGVNYWLTNSPPSTFARNPDCWAATADLSGVVVSTGTGAPAWHGTLLTPRHIIMAKHAHNGVGSIKRFRGRSGTNYTRTVTAILDPKPGQAAGNIHGDYVFGRLNAALPTNDVAVYPVLPANYATYLPTTVQRVPAMIYDQLGRCHVAELAGFGSIVQPADTNRLAYWGMPYDGDSGRPVFAWIGNRLVFLCTLSSATVGLSSPVSYRAGMVALLAADGAALTDVDLSSYTEF